MSEELQQTLQREGLVEPTAFQKEFLSKVNSGKDIIGLAPDGNGKTTSLLIIALHKLKQAFEDAPRCIIVVENDERVREFDFRFKDFTRFSDLRIDAIYDSGKIKDQIDWLFEGSDIVVGTARRLHEMYLQNGLNTNELLMFAIDDANKVMTDRNTKDLERMFFGMPKCQKLICSEFFTDRMDRVVDQYLPAAEVVEFE